MIDCRHIEYIYDSPFHGDVFDHPSYKTYCRSKGKDVHRWLCAGCEQYEPDYTTQSYCALIDEFTYIKNRLDNDDMANPMSGATINKLLKIKDSISKELERRARCVLSTERNRQ